MIYLIEYDRQSGTLLRLEEFGRNRRAQAEEERLRIELMLHACGTEREVVLLEAASEAELRKTHRRYFENLRQLSTPAVT